MVDQIITFNIFEISMKFRGSQWENLLTIWTLEFYQWVWTKLTGKVWQKAEEQQTKKFDLKDQLHHLKWH
jgi:hypothetical protein